MSDLRKRIVITPFYPIRSQLKERSGNSILIEHGTTVSSSNPDLTHIIWARVKADGTPLGMAFCEGEEDCEETLREFHSYLDKPLWQFLKAQQIPFYEV